MDYRERLATQPSLILPSRNGEVSSLLAREIQEFGNIIWKGDPFQIAHDTVIYPGECEVSIKVYPGNLPFNGKVSYGMYDLMEAHMRSRYAHEFLDAKKLAQRVRERLLRSPRTPTPENPVEIKVKMINHGSRPIGLRTGDAPMHLFFVPPRAEIIGDELDSLIDNKVIGIEGKEGLQWFKDNNQGRSETKGVYLGIHKQARERFWIPPSDEVLYIPSGGTFEDVRAFLFDSNTGAFKKANDPKLSMPKGHIFVARLPFLSLPDNVYAILDLVAYAGDRRGTFPTVGFQSNSPLLGPRANKAHNVEMQEENGEKAEYARVRIVRSAGDIAG